MQKTESKATCLVRLAKADNQTTNLLVPWLRVRSIAIARVPQRAKGSRCISLFFANGSLDEEGLAESIAF